MSSKRNKKTFNITIVGLMTAIATIIYMVFPEVQIIPGVEYMKIDFSDFPAILTGVIFGPVQGVLVEIAKNIIHLTKTTTVGIGEIMNIVIGSSMIISMSMFVRLFKKIFKETNLTIKTYAIASAITIIIAIIMGWIANIVFTPIYFSIMGWPLITETYWAGVWGSTTLNSIKAIFNILPFFPIYISLEKGVKKYTI